MRQPGRFTVLAELASGGPSAFEVTVGSDRLKVAAPSTGDYGNFKNVDVGTVSFSAAGRVSLAVKPVAGAWQPINLKSIRLTPVK
jgi:alpha-L-fucosidase